MEAVKRIDVLFDIERSIKGETASRRHAVRQGLSAPQVAELETWMKAERAKLSRHAPVSGPTLALPLSAAPGTFATV